MTDLAGLKDIIFGKSIEYLSERSGIGYDRLYALLSGLEEFSASEITGLSSALGLKIEERNRIFFPED